MVGAVRTDTAQMWESDKPQLCRRDKINAPSLAPAVLGAFPIEPADVTHSARCLCKQLQMASELHADVA